MIRPPAEPGGGGITRKPDWEGSVEPGTSSGGCLYGREGKSDNVRLSQAVRGLLGGSGQGGRMTNRPPSNVVHDTRVLAHNADTIVVSAQVFWSSGEFFRFLREHLDKAKLDGNDVPVVVAAERPGGLAFNVRPWGADGYAFILESAEYTIKIGDWLEPHQRPSVVAEVRSQTLWHHGPEKAVEGILGVLRANGGRVAEVKTSRVDLCVDILLPESEWNPDLRHQAVTRARKTGLYEGPKGLETLMIGRGAVLCRLYDKPLEIAEVSGKWWMFEVWGLPNNEVPPGFRVIRVEFECKREALKEMGFGDWDAMCSGWDNLWAYCTRSWLRMVEVKVHHTHERLLGWWKLVQAGFPGAPGAVEAVRHKVYEVNLAQAVRQVRGHLTSIIAMNRQNDPSRRGEWIRAETLILEIDRILRRNPFDEVELNEEINRKLARYATTEPDPGEVSIGFDRPAGFLRDRDGFDDAGWKLDRSRDNAEGEPQPEAARGDHEQRNGGDHDGNPEGDRKWHQGKLHDEYGGSVESHGRIPVSVEGWNTTPSVTPIPAQIPSSPITSLN